MVVGDVCENPYVLNVILFANEIIKIVYYCLPFALIVLITIDFVKGIINGEEANTKYFMFALKRCICAVGLFLVPSFVDLTMDIVGTSSFKGEYSSCLSNINNVAYYTEKYEALEKAKEEEKEAVIKAKVTEYQHKVSLMKKKLNVKSVDRSSVTIGSSYNLSDSQIKDLAAVCISENGGLDGVKGEASFMANLYELKGKEKYSSLYDYILYGGWFGSKDKVLNKINKRSSQVTDEYFTAVKDALVNGNRTLPLYIDEHDCWDCNNSRCNNGNRGDICKLEVNGKDTKSMSDIKNRSNYIKDSTKIYSKYKQKDAISYYTFYTFLTERSDPFGYTQGAYNKIKGQG